MAILPHEPSAQILLRIDFGELSDEQVAQAIALLADPVDGPAPALVAGIGAWMDANAALAPVVSLTANTVGEVTLTTTPDPDPAPDPAPAP